MNCLQCRKAIPEREYQGGEARRFCSDKCRKEAWLQKKTQDGLSPLPIQPQTVLEKTQAKPKTV